jgi:HEAT repeat protein
MSISKRLKDLLTSPETPVEEGKDKPKDDSTILENLLLRMIDSTPYKNSDDSISWQTHREAENLEDIEFLELAKIRLNIEKKPKLREAIYFLIAKIALNTNTDVVDFLLEEAKKEKNKYVIMSLLDRITELPKKNIKNVEQIIEFSKDERWQIRIPAISALNISSCEAAERRLIEILETSDKPDDILHANSSLSQIGTSRALSSIKKHLNSSKPDVRSTAQSAIFEIYNREINAVGGEQQLIDMLKNSEDTFDIICANIFLRRKGTLKAIPFIEIHLRSKNPDVKFTARYAIHEIKRRIL